MIDLVAFGIIIDDIVFPNGHTSMGVVGGGGPQTAFGMRLPALAGWSNQGEVGLVAGVGRDLPQAAREWLASADIDLTGVRESDWPTPRAWQVLETDGRRTQVWRVEGRVIGAQLGRTVDHIPTAYHTALGFHLGIHPDEPGLDFIHQLRDLHTPTSSSQPPTSNLQSPIISLEPFKAADHTLNDTALRAVCSASDIFSPSVTEAQSLVGQGLPEELVHRLADAGARIVTLRMGEQGSLVYSNEHGIAMHVPAIPTTVIDSTGAGNAYCGGFLAGYIQTGDLLIAARYGAVAASFLVEQIGLPPITDQLRIEANTRLAWLNRVEAVP